MKVLIALLACVAVSQAAFTANLRQRAQPVLSQASFKVRLASGRSDFQTDLIDSLNQQANGLLEQLENAVATGSNMADSILAELQSTWATISDMGGQIATGAGNAWDAITDLLSGTVGSIWETLFGGKGKNLGAIADLLSGLGLNVDAISEVISSVVAQAHEAISGLNFEELLQNAISAVVGHLTGSRGLTDILSQLQTAGQNALNTVVSAGQGALNNLVSQLTQHLAPAVAQIQAMAQQAVTEGTAYIQNVLHQAQVTGQELLNLLKPYAQHLGQAYNQIAQLVGQLTN